MTISLYDREENTVRKGVNAGYQFSKAFFFRFVKSRDCVVKVGIVWLRVNRRFQSYSTGLAGSQSNTKSGIVGYRP